MRIGDACTEIKTRLTAEDVARHYGLHVNKAGWTICPFHRDKHPSMKLYPGSRGYYCYSCHEGGDVIHLTAGLLNCSTVDAVNALNADFNLGLDIEAARKPLTAEERAAAVQRDRARAAARVLDEWRWHEVNRRCARICIANNLPDDPDTWTAEQLDALQHKAQDEYNVELLMGDDTDDITAAYMEMMDNGKDQQQRPVTGCGEPDNDALDNGKGKDRQ